MRIVKEGVKMDLHIHSSYSKHKDKGKPFLLNNTIENVKILVDQLEKNCVKVCAISDHDVFSYDLYKTLKENEKVDGILKVLPAIEFSVLFKTEDGEKKPIHIVCVFDDTDEEKIKKIQEITTNTKDGDYFPKYDLPNNYSFEKFINLLGEIDLSVILIAHQKGSPLSGSNKKNDLTSLGKLGNELLFTRFFDALEFRNKKNEVFNKVFLKSQGHSEKIDFVTGSDCHDWTTYPYVDQVEKNKGISLDEKYPGLANPHTFQFTYVKSLPTFKGLSMAFSDFSRFSLENDFFSNSNVPLESLELELGSRKYSIPMSAGINVIIGDNSIGKSMLLHDLTDYEYLKNTKIKKGYKDYKRKIELVISSKISKEQILEFDKQGEIREKFELNKLNGNSFFNRFFPKNMSASVHMSELDSEVDRLLSVLEKSEKYRSSLKNIPNIDLSATDYHEINHSLNITPTSELRDSKVDAYRAIVNWVDEVITLLMRKNQLSLEQVEHDDISKSIENYWTPLKMNYQRNIKHEVELDNIYNIVQTKINQTAKDLIDIGTSYQRNSSRISGESSIVKSKIIEIIDYEKTLIPYKPKLRSHQLDPISKQMGKYNFVMKPRIEKIDVDYFISVMNHEKVLRKGTTYDPTNISDEQLLEMITRPDDNVSGKQALTNKMNSIFKHDLKWDAIINDAIEEKDITTEMSSGFNQVMYFDILGNNNHLKGMYLVDQPEDNVSQKAINDSIISNIKAMSKNRQVLLVTHNPQFIVNLDVDNVISFELDENDNFEIKYGSLEYDQEYSILESVAENIEGGIEVIRKRWERYEKKY